MFMRLVNDFLSSRLRRRVNCGSPHRGRVSFFARAKKETKESTPRMAHCSSPPRLWGPAQSQRGILPRGPVAYLPVRDPFGALAQSLTGLGRAIRGLRNTFPLFTSVKWNDRFFQAPVARAEYRSPSGSFQASPCLSRAALFVADELASARSGEERKEAVARSGVSFSLVPFSWTSKRKEPRVQGRSHPLLAFNIAAGDSICSYCWRRDER